MYSGRKKIIVISIILVVLLIVLAGGVVFAYLTTDLFKSNQTNNGVKRFIILTGGNPPVEY